jgi:hypothetical protein
VNERRTTTKYIGLSFEGWIEDSQMDGNEVLADGKSLNGEA